MTGHSGDSLPGIAGVPPAWDRHYRAWARRAVRNGRPAPGRRRRPSSGPGGDGILEAALATALMAALSGVVGLVVVASFDFGLEAGLTGLGVGALLSFRWVSRAITRLSRDER